MALYKLSDRMDPGDLERALPIRASAEADAMFGVTWIAPPPAFNLGVYEPVAMSAAAKRNPDPEHPAIQQIHACEFSNTGYFGNEGSDTEFYVYAALKIDIPRLGTRSRPARKGKNRSSQRAMQSA